MQPDQLRQRAAECDATASAMRDPEVQSQLHEIARQWRDLARRLESLNRLMEHYRA